MGKKVDRQKEGRRIRGGILMIKKTEVDEKGGDEKREEEKEEEGNGQEEKKEEEKEEIYKIEEVTG